MPRFRKKPIEVEAVRYDGSIESAYEVDDFCGYRSCLAENDRLLIHTLEGEIYASPGDWIVRGVEGEFYPVKPSIFAKTYEPIEG